jgi:hypothetical protein
MLVGIELRRAGCRWTLSLRILPCVPGPLSRRSRGVHLPVSSSTSSAFPRTLSRSASRVSPSKRFHDGSPFRDCSHFVMFRPSGLLASPIVPTAAAYRRRAAEAFTSELNRLRCLRLHRICLPPAQAIGGVGTYTPLDSQPCRLLQRNGDILPTDNGGRIRAAVAETSIAPPSRRWSEIPHPNAQTNARQDGEHSS